jgi:hypothetical protein
MAAVGMWCGLPTAGGRGTPFGFLLVLACPCRKEAIQPWFTKSNEEPRSFTPVRTEADRIEKCVPLAAHAI